MFARKVSMHLKLGRRGGIQEENGGRGDSHSAQAGRVPRRNHLPIPQREKKFMPSVCGRPRNTRRPTTVNVSRSDQDPGVRS